MRRQVILAVDINRSNLELLTKYLKKEGYEIVGVSSLDDFDRVLDDTTDIGMAVVDIAGFDKSIWDRCEQLRDAKIPFLVLSPKQSAGMQEEGVTHGALAVLVKPLAVKEFLKVIQGLLEE